MDFRQRTGRRRTIWTGRLDHSQVVSWRDDASLKRNLVEVAHEFGRAKRLTVMPPAVNRRVVILNKNELLLNYPLPESAQFVLSAQEGWKYSPDCSDEEVIENIFFFVQTPWCEGEIWKKAATGFRRGWKKMWCVLQKETLCFYSDQSSTNPVGGVHIRNVEFCYQSEFVDAQSKKLGHVFKIGTTSGEKVIYLGVAQKEQMVRWMKEIAGWIEYSEFFKPKAITERGFALSHILSGQIRPNPKTYPGGESSGVEYQQNQIQQQQAPTSATTAASAASSAVSSPAVSAAAAAAASGGDNSASGIRRASSAVDLADTNDHLSAIGGAGSAALEVQPNREVTVMLVDGSLREMVVDSRLDVYELAYMIAEEIRSENAFIISKDDFGYNRQLELLDHQSSLASQQIPLSARLSVRKTGIVDDFVKECDIYDNHFLFVTLPTLEAKVLVKDPAGAWRSIRLRMFAGKLCCVADENADEILAVVVMRHVLSIYHSVPEAVGGGPLADFAFTVTLSESREMHFLANTTESCDEWCDLDGWCGFHCNNQILDPTDQYSWKIHECGSVVDSPFAWLGISPDAVLSPRSREGSQSMTQQQTLPSQVPQHHHQQQQTSLPAQNPDSPALSPVLSPAVSTAASVASRHSSESSLSYSASPVTSPRVEDSTSSKLALAASNAVPIPSGMVVETEDDDDDEDEDDVAADDGDAGDEDEEGSDSIGTKLVGKVDFGAGSLASSIVAKATSMESSPGKALQLSTGSSSPGQDQATRIRRFDWRKSSPSNAVNPSKRRSVEEVDVQEETHEDDAQESESSLALRVPSDDEDDFESVSPRPKPATIASPRKTGAATSTAAAAGGPAVAATSGSKIVSSASPSSFSATPTTTTAIPTTKKNRSPLPVAKGTAEKPPGSVSFVPAPSVKPKKTSIVVVSPPASAGSGGPQVDVSRLIRRAYESVEPVKLKALPDNDPSLYCWKVLHSINLQKLGYSSLRDDEVVFYDLRGHEVLRVPKNELPGLSVPAARLERVAATLKQMRKSSKLDAATELQRVYEVEGAICLRRARDAEFEFRVVVKDGGDQVGWATRTGLDTLFYDMNGMSLASFATQQLGPNVLEPMGSARLQPTDIRSLFNTQREVSIVKCPEAASRYEFRVLLDDGSHVGWGEREAFDFAFADLTGRVLGRVPLVAMPQLAILTEMQLQQSSGAGGASGGTGGSGSMVKKRSSSGAATKGMMLGRLKGQEVKKQAVPTSPSTTSPIVRSGSQSLLGRATGLGRSNSVVLVVSDTSGAGAGATGGAGSASSSSSSSSSASSLAGSSSHRNSGPFKAAAGSDGLAKKRSESVDYTPDGLSPELQDSGYDVSSTHRPMGLAGLLGEPDDSSE